MSTSILYVLFVIFSGAALLATLALYARQALILSYVVLGALAGPAVTGLIPDTVLTSQIAEIGIIFLLYLLGLNLYPQKLLLMLRQALAVTGLSSLGAAALGYAAGWLFGLPAIDRLVLAAALMFSSTILGLKLLPTTALHHRHAGEIIISVLLLQDIIAIVVLVALRSAGGEAASGWLQALGLPLLLAIAYVMGRWVLPLLLARFDRLHEYLFLLALGWCLGMAEGAVYLGLPHESGAFIAGVALASHPISRYIAESLKPLRDFFLVIFFFTLGARFELDAVRQVFGPALALAAIVLIAKPLLFDVLLRRSGEAPKLSREIGVRLGQISEFSLLIAIVALDAALIQPATSYLIQLATLFAFAVSSLWIVRYYPTPIAVDDNLRRD